MSIILKIIKETPYKLYFEQPNIFFYEGKTVSKFTTSCALMYALNKNKQKLCDIIIGKENYNVDWESVRFERKKLVVNKYFSIEEKNKIFLEEKNKIIEERSYHECLICKIKCKKSKKLAGCCSLNCAKENNKKRGINIAKNHWCKSHNAKQIKDKILKIKKENDIRLKRKYVPWNKGKKGIYSQETIEKIRAATIKQFENEVFKKTKIERIFEDFLKLENIEYKYSFFIQKRQYDFYINKNNKKYVVEIQGDFWHANPLFYGNEKKPLREHQKIKKLDDIVKKRIAEENGYILIEYWENDIYHNFESIKNNFLSIIEEGTK